MPLLEKFQSDNLISMKKVMTATEVARNFSEVLDAIESGDEITITRGNKAVALLSEAKEPIPNSILLAKALEVHFAKYGQISNEEAERRLANIRAMRDADLELEIQRGKWNV
jgi:antitoxin (DNA-binding transcriptional repressor) of toxin-antitoxin stability system